MASIAIFVCLAEGTRGTCHPLRCQHPILASLIRAELPRHRSAPVGRSGGPRGILPLSRMASRPAWLSGDH